MALMGPAQAAAAITYALSESYVGESFFSRWNFFTGPDPTHGAVHYVGYADALAAGLVRASSDHVYMGADMSTVTSEAVGRRSVRVESQSQYNQGLFVLSLNHMPTGCGTWPAFWMFGHDAQHDWPEWGEFDIIEGVHEARRVQTTLHTTEGCDQISRVPGWDFSGSWAAGQTKAATDCFIHAEGQYEDQGCVQHGPDGSMGADFNGRGGGTFAAEWDPLGQRFRTWFWPTGAEPADLQQRKPQPDSWGMPYSSFSLTPAACPASHFRNMRLVFDLTFCGDLGNFYYAQACPDIAAQMSCDAFVASQPTSMSQAFWSIRSLDTYMPAAPIKGRSHDWMLLWVLAIPAIALAGAACYVLDRTRHSGGDFPARSVKAVCPGFWETGTALSRKYPPSGALAALRDGWALALAWAAGLPNSFCRPWDDPWEAVPLERRDRTGSGSPLLLAVGDEVVVRTRFMAVGKWYGHGTLPPHVRGIVEEVRPQGTTVIRFMEPWGTFIVQRNQFVHLDIPLGMADDLPPLQLPSGAQTPMDKALAMLRPHCRSLALAGGLVALVLLLLLGARLLGPRTCTVLAPQRRPCGSGAGGEAECAAEGCCWEPASAGVPWCFSRR